MGIDIDSILKFLKDKSVSLKIKILRVILVFVILLAVNDYLGFTYYYNLGQKINLIEKIEKTKSSKELNPDHKKILIELEAEIINRKNVFTQCYDYLSHLLFSEKQIKQEAQKERSLLVHILSSSIIWIVLFLFFFVAILVDKDENDSETIWGIVIGLILLVFLAFIFQLALGFLPIIFGNPTYNYFLNAIIQIGFVILIIWLFNKFVGDDDEDEED